MATFRPDPLAYLTGRLEPGDRPRSISDASGGGKFLATGEVLQFPGNTIICHIDKTSRAFEALVALQECLKRGPYAACFTYLPHESFHMTVFQGISGTRIKAEDWPKRIELGSSRDEVTAHIIKELDALSMPTSFRIASRDLFAGHSLTVEGADDAEEDALRSVRNTLRDRLGIRRQDFDTYTFHVTLAYLLTWVDQIQAREIVGYSSECYRAFEADLAEIRIGPMELCVFENMHRFECVATLGRNGIDAVVTA